MSDAKERRRKVCIVTSNRSDWSKLQPVAFSLVGTPSLELSVVAVGSHLLQEFGHTIDEVKRSFPGVIEVPTLVAGDTISAMVNSVGFGIIQISNVLSQLKPDVCLIHGDRFEAFSAAVAANLSNIAVAHIEGGELSGTIDGYLRHAVTKISHIHLACSEDAVHRIQAMGEKSSSIFLTGCPSYERLFAIDANSWHQCGKIAETLPDLIRKKYILAVMHPCVTDEMHSLTDYDCLLHALFTLKKDVVFIYPNVDPGNKKMMKILHKYQKDVPDWAGWLFIHTHINPDMFAVLMREASVMVGNSSAGIRETCVFGTPTLNVGNRQRDRLQPANVTTITDPNPEQIMQWIVDNYEVRFPPSTEFGSGDSPRMISNIILEADLCECMQKSFSDFQHLIPRLPLTLASGASGITKHRPMANLPRVLGIITARGGSKGIPGKNIIELGHKPLIEYTVQAAKSSKLLDRFILSTDCDVIARVAADSGCEVPFMRPKELAHDSSPHMDCIKHALQTLAHKENYHADFVMILQPTSPFRTAEDIDSAISIIMDTSCDAVVSVSKSRLPLTKTFHIQKETNRLLPYAISMPTSKYIRRQDSSCLYSENGAIFVQRASSILNPSCTRIGSLFSKDVQAYIMPIERSLDVDESYDLEIARALLAHRRLCDTSTK